LSDETGYTFTKTGSGQAQRTLQNKTRGALLSAGTFGCAGDLDPQAAQISAKLKSYYEWAKEEPRIAGIVPW